MIVVLLVTTVATNFVVMMRNKNGSLIEGLTTEEENKKKEAAAADGADAKVALGATAKKVDTPAKPAPPEGSVPSQAAPNAEASMEEVAAATGNTKSNKNITESLSNLSPAPVGSEGNSMLDLQKGLASGYGDQKEQIYKALSSLGGAGAAGTTSKMSSDTLNQQTEMINNLKSIQPILDTAEKFLDKFENSSISKLFSSAGSIPGMSLLTGGLGKTSSPVGAQA